MNRPFQFRERSQLFIRTYDEPVSVAMSIGNPDQHDGIGIAN